MEMGNGKIYKPKAKLSFIMDQKHIICEWVKGLRMLNDYAIKLVRQIDINEGKLFGIKSHNYHMFMEHLLPITFIDLPKPL